ncbi:MAG: UTP--glucose-1-phosphate uridylyltransferase, partial [Janthinobacterium lividum]
MSAEGLQASRTKMAEAGVQPQAIEVFTHYYHQLEEGVTGLIAEDSIDPLTDPPMLTSVEVAPEQAAEALGRTAIIKLNGGLGTSMGMEKAKSLLPVR